MLKGTKTFQLWSPELVWRMHTHGKPVQLHPNGRIVYEGQVSSFLLQSLNMTYNLYLHRRELSASFSHNTGSMVAG